jgi:hypothetical protein
MKHFIAASSRSAICETPLGGPDRPDRNPSSIRHGILSLAGIVRPPPNAHPLHEGCRRRSDAEAAALPYADRPGSASDEPARKGGDPIHRSSGEGEGEGEGEGRDYIYVPEAESCFFVFDSPSGREAAVAAQRARLDRIRVVLTVSSGKEEK